MPPITLVWKVWKLMCAEPRRYFFAAYIAKQLNVTWLEAYLAMWVLLEQKLIVKRRDGRFLANPDKK